MFYIYFHRKSDTGEVFYIGKGQKKYKYDRAYMKENHNKWWKNIVNKHGYIVEIICYFDNEYLSCITEKYFIKKIGRRDLGLGPLVNLTDGGEGLSGHIFTKEHREKIGTANKCRIIKNETREKQSRIATDNNYAAIIEPHRIAWASFISGKSYAEIYGEEKALKMKNERSLGQIGEKNHRFGIKMTEDQIQIRTESFHNRSQAEKEKSTRKRSESAKNRPPISKDTRKKLKSLRWFNNGIIDKRFSESPGAPWLPGRVLYKRIKNV